MVGFPCLLGGGLAAVVGSNRSRWLPGLGARLGKGLLAGLVLGFVYMTVLNMGIVSGMFTNPETHFRDQTEAHIAVMWRNGPLALGIASALFFVLIRWAVGLIRVRLLVFEETKAEKKGDENVVV